MSTSAKRIGGIHFYGLCGDCNGLQSRWDPAYAELARLLSPFLFGTNSSLPPGSAAGMPHGDVLPGAIARSVFIGAFALNPALRDISPDSASALLNRRAHVPVPEGTQLEMALTLGPTARVTGAMSGFHLLSPKIEGRSLGASSLAQIYFPPMAWRLVDEDHITHRHEDWANVSSWLTYPPDAIVPLDDLVPHLPVVLPHRVNNHDDWVELLAHEACFIVESDCAIPRQWTSLSGA